MAGSILFLQAASLEEIKVPSLTRALLGSQWSAAREERKKET